MKKKPKIWTFSERLKYFILPFATMICYCIRMYASAVISAKFDFKYVHYVMGNSGDIQDLAPKHEALHVLLYIEREDASEPSIVFRSKLAQRLVDLKKKGSVIDNNETFESVMLRVMLNFFEIKCTKQLPARMKSPLHLYALRKFGVRMKIEPELYQSVEHLKAMVRADIYPNAPLDARKIPVECVDWIIKRSRSITKWVQFESLNIDQQVLYLKDSPSELNNDHAALPAIKLGLLRHTADFLPRLFSFDFCPNLDEIVHFCNEHKIRFELGVTEQEVHIIQAMLKLGLNYDLVHEDELILEKHKSFQVEHFNAHAFQNAVKVDTWRAHLRAISKHMTDDDWEDVERLVLATPSRLRIIPKQNQSASMVQAYFRHKKARTDMFFTDHQAYLDIIPYLVSERPKLARKIVAKQWEPKLGEAFAAEIKKLETLPIFVTKRSLTNNLKHAWLKDCLYSKEHLRRADITEVLACTHNGDAMRFINKHIASHEGDRHVELYTEAVREDILMEELGL